MRRFFFRQDIHFGKSVQRYVNPDSSPQAGVEIFCTMLYSITDSDPSTLVRFRLPICQLHHGRQSAVDKTCTLLFSVILITGMQVHAIRKYLSSIRAVLTDWGVESLVADSRDILPEFLERITGRRIPCEPQQYLLPRAIQCPGWHHVFDNLMQLGFESMGLFAEWFDSFKATCNFISVEIYKDVIVKKLQMLNKPELIKRVKSFSASFIHWRWHTLADCSRELQHISELRLFWKRSWFLKVQKGVQLNKISSAMESDSFWRQLNLTVDCARLINSTRTWGSGQADCVLHEFQPKLAIWWC